MAKRPRVDQLIAQIQELELRVKLLEARMRATAEQARRPQIETARRSREARRATRMRPRCPGCLLEIPPGRHGDACVWCGFRFDVAKPITLGRRGR